MKKLFLVFVVLFASCFEVKVEPREVMAQKYYSLPSAFTYMERHHANMRYGIYAAPWTNSNTGYGIFIINITKDSLEVELLKKQLK